MKRGPDHHTRRRRAAIVERGIASMRLTFWWQVLRHTYFYNRHVGGFEALRPMTEMQPRAIRRPANQDAMIYGATTGARIAPCRLRNISATGAQIELFREVDLPKTFLLSLSTTGGVQRRCTIAWQFSTVVGVKFEVDRKQA
jgi:hypothetical protein